MFFNIFKNVLSKRWPDGSVWLLCPDKNSFINWEKIVSFLENRNFRFELRKNNLLRNQISIKIIKEFGVHGVNPIDSMKQPLIQLADLFAGMTVFSRKDYDLYENWLRTQSRQRKLFENLEEFKVSNSAYERCRVLCEIDSKCKENRLYISLKSNRGLKSYKPDYPINFWFYQPQHDMDKAPIRYDI